MAQEMETEEQTPRVDTWAADGKVALIIVRASIIEYEGDLVPGLNLTVRGAMELARDLLSHATKAEDGGEDGEEDRPKQRGLDY